MNETTSTTANTEQADTFISSVMRIAERVNGKNEFKKFLSYGLPTLDQVIAGAPAPDKWDSETIKEGDEEAEVKTPVYESDILAFLQTALVQRVQGIARSRDNAGMDPSTNWAELLESSGGNRYPAQLKAFKDGLAEFLAEQDDLTDRQIGAILVYTDSRRLSEADPVRKERVGFWFNSFIEAIEDTSEVKSVISSLTRALEFDPAEVDF